VSVASPPDPTALAIAVGEPLATAVLDGTARITPVTVPGLVDGAVWQVVDDVGEHPIRVYVGAWPDGRVRVLSGDQDAWAELAAATRARVSSTKVAVGYIDAYLEATRGTMVRVQPIGGVADIEWRPGSADEEAAKAALLADPPDLATVAQATPGGFHVERALVVDQRVQRNEFDVSHHGAITASYEVLAEALPLPIIR
jgi:hypothetical protein